MSFWFWWYVSSIHVFSCGAVKKRRSGVFPDGGNHLRIAWRYAPGRVGSAAVSTHTAPSASTVIAPSLNAISDCASDQIARPLSETSSDAHWFE